MYVLLLSTVPCCTEDKCEDDIATAQLTNQSQEKHDDCEGCSPFMTCGSCTGFTFSTQVFSFEPTTKFIENNSLTRSFKVLFVDYFIATIWQPPKIS